MGSGKFAEQADEIGVGIDAVGLAGFDERVQVRTGVGSRHRISKEPITPPDDEGADGVLAEVVVCALLRHV